MHFGLTEEQTLLQETLRKFTAQELPAPRLRELFDAGAGFDGTLWRAAAEVGLTGLTVSADHGLRFVAPPLPLCTDNAAMIAWAGVELDAINHPGLDPLIARPRWPLDAQQPAMLGSGKKGAKA